MARVYKVPFAKQSISAAVDLFTVSGALGVKIHEINLDVETATTPEEVSIELLRITGAFVPGTGGTAITPQPTYASDAAATALATGYATAQGSGGTATVLHAGSWQLMNGYQYLPVPEDRIALNTTAYFVVRLLTAFQAAHNVSATMTFEELL